MYSLTLGGVFDNLRSTNKWIIHEKDNHIECTKERVSSISPRNTFRLVLEIT